MSDGSDQEETRSRQSDGSDQEEQDRAEKKDVEESDKEEDKDNEDEKLDEAQVFGENDDDDDDDDDFESRKKPTKKSKRKSSDSDHSDSGDDGEGTKRKSHKSSGQGKHKRTRRDKSDEDSGDNAPDEPPTYQDSDDDEEDAINRGDVVDTETGEAVTSSKLKGKRLGKRDQKELMEKEKEQMKKFINDLKNAALDDMEAYKRRQTAMKKMELLPKLVEEISKSRKQQMYIELGILKSMKLWLDPLKDGSFKDRASSLPNKKLLAEVCQLLLKLPLESGRTGTDGKMFTTDNMQFLLDSEIARSVRFITNAFKDDMSCEACRLAQKVRAKWSRLVYKKAEGYKHTADQQDEDDEPHVMPHIPKANREWEKMPANINAKGEKAAKGEYGFRYGASVPRPMLFDFTMAPESKIDVEERLESSKERNRELRDRLIKVGIEHKRGDKAGRNERADAPELNRMHVGGVASKITSIGWAEKEAKKKK
uniref:TFIIS N-terminal domain-containing protein n=1 Tax=Guillardia theta TaxID=55529 RepID=A0A7S4P0L4_GUITH|mmetsp:Transcript_40633/g.128125  ORF Transcript_40633/g.128125 Transcript_40633/m.128125 type:complete len:481 (+) Transcript_40633:3-1445(+)